MDWLDGWEQIPATTAGGSYIGAPWRLVLHTTEGPSIASALAAYRFHGGWPHVTVDPQTSERVQHYPLSVSSRALAHPKGTPETNRANVINVEIVGQAARIGDLSPDDLAWLGTEVVRPLCEAVGIPLSTSVEWVAYPASYGFGAPQRLTWSEWAGYSGVLAHEHVPGNDHGDAGALEIATILAHATTGDDMELSGHSLAQLDGIRSDLVNVAISDIKAANTRISQAHEQLAAKLDALADTVGGIAAGGGGTVDLDALAAKVADLLAARLAS